MKFIRRFKLPQFLLIVSVVAFLILPTVVTFSLMKRNDAANRKMDEVARELAVQSNIKTVESTEADNEDILGQDNRRLEKDTTDQNPLTLGVSDATAGDAELSETAGDASMEDEDLVQDTVVEPNGKKVYLTFDDGPSENTNEILDILAQYDVKATFFVVADSYKYMDQLARIAAEGHTIGLHSASHVYSRIYADMDSYKRDVEGVHDTVQRITGVDSKYYRFPGGSSNSVSNVSIDDCISYLHENGYEYFDWNALSRDAEYTGFSPEELNGNIMAGVRNNEGDSIVLMHDLDEHHNTVEALPALIETLKAEGYTLCPIDASTTPVQHYVPAEN